MSSTLLLVALASLWQAAQPASVTVSAGDPIALIQSYNEATRSFRPDMLESVFAPDYTEVSPVGEVDARAKVISFYPAGKSSGLKAIRLEEPQIRRYGDIAVVIGKEVFEGASAAMAMRATFVCRKQKKRWWLVSAQFTGIRPAKKSSD